MLILEAQAEGVPADDARELVNNTSCWSGEFNFERCCLGQKNSTATPAENEQGVATGVKVASVEDIMAYKNSIWTQAVGTL